MDDVIVHETEHMESDGEDTCAMTDDKYECWRAEIRVKMRCLKEITAISEIYDDEIVKLNEFLSIESIDRNFKKFKTFRANLNKIRKRTLPNLPTNTDDIFLEGAFVETIDKKRFILFDCA